MATAAFLVVVGLFCFDSVAGAKVQCDLHDSDCVTKVSKVIFPEFVNGIPGVEPSDPLRQELIVADLPTIKYTIKNGALSGFKKCGVELIRFSKDLTYEYNIKCPLVTIEGEYEIKGNIGKNYIEGKGTFKADHYDYHFLLHGNYEIMKRDGKTYVRFTTHTLNLDVKGKVVYNLRNLFNGDKQKSDAAHKMMNENWREVDQTLRQPAMEAFIKVFKKNLNEYTKIKAVEDVLNYDE
ncbi:hypothetical protein HW555_001811 [Spodoptera exigua]|uniref:Uncharacterized protein n=1 Tax=Spodoptera exigua TaxID=7107 RepID=A0A835L7P5_SPOEX|nr:hypothetical protein HW555_001811 [Spodoptera exigua]